MGIMACVLSAPGNELRGYCLQSPEKALPFRDFFKPEKFLRSTSVGALIMAVSLGVGTLATPQVEKLWGAIRDYLKKHPVSYILVILFGVNQVLQMRAEGARRGLGGAEEEGLNRHRRCPRRLCSRASRSAGDLLQCPVALESTLHSWPIGICSDGRRLGSQVDLELRPTGRKQWEFPARLVTPHLAIPSLGIGQGWVQDRAARPCVSHTIAQKTHIPEGVLALTTSGAASIGEKRVRAKLTS